MPAQHGAEPRTASAPTRVRRAFFITVPRLRPQHFDSGNCLSSFHRQRPLTPLHRAGGFSGEQLGTKHWQPLAHLLLLLLLPADMRCDTCSVPVPGGGACSLSPIAPKGSAQWTGASALPWLSESHAGSGLRRSRHSRACLSLEASHGADAFLTFACSGYTPPSVRARFNRKLVYPVSCWGV